MQRRRLIAASPLAVSLLPIWLGAQGCSYDISLERTNTTQGGHAGSTSFDSPSGGVAGSSSTNPVHALRPRASWQWQLTGTLDTTIDAEVFVLDLFDTSDADLGRLKASGVVLVCQFSAGTSESWRTDVRILPDLVLGNATDAEPEETWLDIAAPSVRQLMLSRLDLAVTRGCDAVLPDSVDGYGSSTGFPIGMDESLDYLTFLAAEARRRSLAMGLANCAELVERAEPFVDFGVVANCLTYRECSAFGAFVEAAKPVFHAELFADVTTGEQRFDGICTNETRRGFSTIVKSASLSPWRLACAD